MRNAWRRYLRLLGPNVEADVDDELQFHLEMRIRDYEARGLSRDDAERAARERFGDLEHIHRRLRTHDHAQARLKDRRELMDRIHQDVRIALRGLRRSPTFVISAVAILGIGIGMAAAMATVFHSVLVRELPVRDQDRIVALRIVDKTGGDVAMVGRTSLEQLRRASRMVTGITGYAHWGAFPFPLTDGDRPILIPQTWVTGNFFDVLGARPLLGRLLRPADDAEGAAHVMVISYSTWQRVFGADRAIVGRHITSPGRQWTYTIVGVAPPGLDFPAQVGGWEPIVPVSATYVGLDVVARLAPKATPDAARAEFLAQMQSIDAQDKEPVHVQRATVKSLTNEMLGDVRPILIALTAGVGLLLLIACVNVGNLLLLRATTRVREVAIRRAMGATYGDVARLFLVESTLLAVAGGAVGVACAEALLRLLVRLAPAQLPRGDVIALGAAPVAFALVVTLVAVLLFGVLPALGAARTNLASSMRLDARAGASRQRVRLRLTLVASQVALALVMLAGAGLLVRSLERLERQKLGYTPEHLSILELTLPFDGYDTQPKFYAMLDRAYARIRGIPGIAALTPILIPPFLGPDVWWLSPEIEGDAQSRIADTHVPLESVGAEYFRTFEVPILRGRGISDSDRENAPRVAVVSQSMARQYWPDADPLGKRFRARSGDTVWRTVVGVAGDTHFRSLRTAAPMVYLPWHQFSTQVYFAIRTTGELPSVLPAVRGALREVDPHVTVWRARTMDEFLAGPLAQPRLSAFLLSGFGLVALVLAAVGLYGVMAAAVREQTREIGVRMALGATPSMLRRSVLVRALRVTAAGSLVGAAAALIGARLLKALLFEVSPNDPLALLGACGLLISVALAAAYLPARRATRIDPAQALRAD